MTKHSYVLRTVRSALTKRSVENSLVREATRDVIKALMKSVEYNDELVGYCGTEELCYRKGYFKVIKHKIINDRLR